MGFLKGFVDKLFGGDIEKMPDEEFAEKVAELSADPVTGPASTLEEVAPSQGEEIPPGLSPMEMWEIYGVTHFRWETAGPCPCKGCQMMDGAIFEKYMARLVDARRHPGCNCRWVPLHVLRGMQKKECSLPDAPPEAFKPGYGDLLTRIYEAEKFFPGKEEKE